MNERQISGGGRAHGGQGRGDGLDEKGLVKRDALRSTYFLSAAGLETRAALILAKGEQT